MENPPLNSFRAGVERYLGDAAYGPVPTARIIDVIAGQARLDPHFAGILRAEDLAVAAYLNGVHGRRTEPSHNVPVIVTTIHRAEELRHGSGVAIVHGADERLSLVFVRDNPDLARDLVEAWNRVLARHASTGGAPADTGTLDAEAA